MGLIQLISKRPSKSYKVRLEKNNFNNLCVHVKNIVRTKQAQKKQKKQIIKQWEVNKKGFREMKKKNQRNPKSRS